MTRFVSLLAAVAAFGLLFVSLGFVNWTTYLLIGDGRPPAGPGVELLPLDPITFAVGGCLLLTIWLTLRDRRPNRHSAWSLWALQITGLGLYVAMRLQRYLANYCDPTERDRYLLGSNLLLAAGALLALTGWVHARRTRRPGRAWAIYALVTAVGIGGIVNRCTHPFFSPPLEEHPVELAYAPNGVAYNGWGEDPHPILYVFFEEGQAVIRATPDGPGLAGQDLLEHLRSLPPEPSRDGARDYPLDLRVDRRVLLVELSDLLGACAHPDVLIWKLAFETAPDPRLQRAERLMGYLPAGSAATWNEPGTWEEFAARAQPGMDIGGK